MCGICGWVNIKRNKEYSNNYSMLKAMADTLYHRGPDDEGFWINNEASLGHRRLSILDLKYGHQPMSGRDGSVIVFNGEIYNYKELRGELMQKGVIFQTNSDTEVLLNAYKIWGTACLLKFIGMFAFAIWCPRKKELFIARDPLGKKPLYYFRSDSLFAFASEIKALLTLKEIKDTIDINAHAISDYLSLGYILTPKTIFTRIYKIPAGHYGIYRMFDDIFNIKKYWFIEEFYKRPIQNKGTIAFTNKTKKALTEEFTELFDDAVKLRTRSDVPLGAFLSGGVDSSFVTASMCRATENPVQAFCIGFPQISYDETFYAKLAANHMNVNLNNRSLNCLSNGELSKLVWHFDEPFSDNSMIPTYQLCKLTREFVTVALSGDGADEIFAGYPTYLADKLYKLYSRVPFVLQSGLSRLASMVVRPSYKKVSWDYKITQFLKGFGNSPEYAHYWWRVIFSDKEKQHIMSPVLSDLCRDYDPFDTFDDYFNNTGKIDFLNKSLYVDIKTWLQDDILVKVDRMSMAASLEVRSPFLDRRVVEFSACLPGYAKIDGMKQKVILKDSMKNRLPGRIINRPKKGFNTPGQLPGLNPVKNHHLFSGNFNLDSTKEDITFKSFNLSILQKWLDIYDNYKKTARWEPVEYAT
ncbi:MAG: asparagine synthase (glutamine-hydrolyzing) [Nitrospirae bacterium]|nr:asparagine synthase (glutamine-hydrolyzing) [Nitrospirota bacterium]